ncbi:hypothetical protein DFH29DRAFT_876786 [Suillus ampliporus]|nr:hypothetical protein DFH29DRAFT_876786 [Suillus ampliporus]
MSKHSTNCDMFLHYMHLGIGHPVALWNIIRDCFDHYGSIAPIEAMDIGEGASNDEAIKKMPASNVWMMILAKKTQKTNMMDLKGGKTEKSPMKSLMILASLRNLSRKTLIMTSISEIGCPVFFNLSLSLSIYLPPLHESCHQIQFFILSATPHNQVPQLQAALTFLSSTGKMKWKPLTQEEGQVQMQDSTSSESMGGTSNFLRAVKPKELFSAVVEIITEVITSYLLHLAYFNPISKPASATSTSILTSSVPTDFRGVFEPEDTDISAETLIVPDINDLWEGLDKPSKFHLDNMLTPHYAEAVLGLKSMFQLTSFRKNHSWPPRSFDHLHPYGLKLTGGSRWGGNGGMEGSGDFCVGIVIHARLVDIRQN